MKIYYDITSSPELRRFQDYVSQCEMEILFKETIRIVVPIKTPQTGGFVHTERFVRPHNKLH